MRVSVKITYFLNRNVSKFTTSSVNLPYELKRETLLAIVLHLKELLVPEGSEGEGGEPKAPGSLFVSSLIFPISSVKQSLRLAGKLRQRD